ncbi:MAG: hypothetical protein QME79_00005, partial [Bacillota bacterium]|nr:hypothetical protein [Bacillota bacterium]
NDLRLRQFRGKARPQRRAAATAEPRAAVGLVDRGAALWPRLPPELAEAEVVQAAVVTLGGALEEEVRRLFQGGRAAEGLYLDAAGNALLRAATREVCCCLEGVWLAPGCPGVPLPLLPEIAVAAGCWRIGVETLPSGMLKPGKSVAGLIVRGAGVWPPACDSCTSPVCPWRGRR